MSMKFLHNFCNFLHYFFEISAFEKGSYTLKEQDMNFRTNFEYLVFYEIVSTTWHGPESSDRLSRHAERQ